MENAEVIAAKVVSVDKKRDLALLQLLKSPTSEFKSIEMGSVDALEIGQDTHAIGHPSGLNWTYTRGFISSYRPEYKWNYANSEHQANVIQTQTPINPGNSGGPLLNNSGQLIGINSYTSDGEGLNFSVSVDEVKQLQNSLPANFKANIEKCEPTLLVFSGRNEADDAYLESYDRDCNSVVDAIYVNPDDTLSPVCVILDDNEDGKPEGYVYDENRDRSWDVSYWDTSGNGEFDIVGAHPDGALYPTS